MERVPTFFATNVLRYVPLASKSWYHTALMAAVILVVLQVMLSASATTHSLNYYITALTYYVILSNETECKYYYQRVR